MREAVLSLPRRRAALIAGLLLSGCSVAPPGVTIHDPYERTNRAIHAFNTGLDRGAMRDSGALAASAPPVVTEPIANFAGNAGLPGAVLNGLLQGDIAGAATNTMRFVVNSTIGVLGIADPAGAIGLREVETDFGETLATWGVPEGAYVELPLLGPSTERDAFGQVVDILIDPFGRIAPPDVARAALPATILEMVLDRGENGALIDEVLDESADSYAQARLAWLQNRRFELSQGPAGRPGGVAEAQTDYFNPYEELE